MSSAAIANAITNAIALAVIAVLAVIYWHGKRRMDRHPPGKQQ